MTREAQSVDDADLIRLLDFLDQTPNQIALSTRGLSDAQFRLKTSSDEFSALENICHLRDLELQGYQQRIELILTETDPILADFDGARVAAESNYNQEQPDIALQQFQNARRKSVEALRALTEEQLIRNGTLVGVGRITLGRLAELMREHDEGHLEDLRVLLQHLKPHKQ
jgi:hypothetical protein